MRVLAIDTTRSCRVCKKIKILTDFVVNNRYVSGFDTMCKLCNRSHVATWKSTQDPIKEKLRHNKVSAKWVDDLKFEVMSQYGPCYCCGEDRLAFLTIDHIEGNGRQHRKEIGMLGYRFYVWLRDNNYPDGYRSACMNCNMATRFGKMCPHKDSI